MDEDYDTDRDEPLVPSWPTAIEQPRFVLFRADGPGEPPGPWRSEAHRITIGTHRSNDVVLEDRAISRFHAEIVLTEGRARLRDLGSKNGTLVDGVAVFDAMLRNGSVMKLGSTSLRFEFADSAVSVPLAARASFGGLVGASAAMRAVYHLLGHASGSDATLLIEGETGTGKDLAAEAVHAAGRRASGPFVVVDCGSVPRSLIESELFGHERGAFTGAVAAHVGAFETAHGGTIFLDEIGELPIDLQPKLLRVLEDRTIQRIGSAKRKAADVRVVAATNRELRAGVNDGSFRPDLYFRLAVLRVRMPALRERPEDIPAIVTSILDALQTPPVTRAEVFTPTFVATLKGSAWPGNVRELRNYVERCALMGGHVPLRTDPSADLRFDVHGPYAKCKQYAVDAFERQYAEHVLGANGGNVSAAARASGMDRVSLYRLRRRHNL